MHQIVFISCLIILTIWVSYKGDYRDYGAVAIVYFQTLIDLATLGNPYAMVGAAIVSSGGFLFFCTRLTGVALGMFSAIIGMCSIGAILGWYPSEVGQGINWNYHHIMTYFQYGQLFILGAMPYVHYDLNRSN